MSTVPRPLGGRNTALRKTAGTTGHYAAGGGFATAIAGVVTACGNAGVSDETAHWAIVAVCLIAGLTMFTAAYMTRGRH